MRHAPGPWGLGGWGLAILALAATLARAQPAPTAPASLPPPTHGYFVLRQDAGPGTGGAVVLHVPPRAGGGAGEGQVRVAASLKAMPAAWAALGPRAYFLFEDPLPPAFAAMSDPRPRQLLTILSGHAEGEAWRTFPQGRPEAAPQADGAGELVALAGGAGRLFLVRRVDQALRLDVLVEGAWQSLDVPPHVQRALARSVVAVGHASGLSLIADDPATGAAMATYSPGIAPLPAGWTLASLPPLPPARAATQLCAVGGQLVAVSSAGPGTLRVRASPLAGAGKWSDLAMLEGVVEPFIVSPMEEDGRVAVLWAGAKGAKGDAGASHGFAEVSVGTGRVLYSHTLRLVSPVSGRDYALLALVMTMVVGMVGVAVLGGREGAILLPAKTSIADPPRRIIAGLVDIALGVVIVTRTTGVAPMAVFTSEFWAGSAGLIAFFQVIAVLVVVGTLSEALTGRTPGKFLAACRVTSVIPDATRDREELRRPTFLRALLRNLIKWGLPPVGVLGVLDPGGRHRHDQLARTAVVVSDEPDAGEGSDPRDDERD